MPFNPERRTFLKATGVLFPSHWLCRGVTVSGAAALLQPISVPVSVSDIISDPVTADLTSMTVDSTLINVAGQGSPLPDDGPLAFSGISPNVLPIGGVTQLTISGTGFEAGSSVRVCSNGLTLNSVAILDANTILVEVDVPAGQAEGTCSVRIDNPDGERVIARDVVTISASEAPPPPPPPPTSEPLAFSGVSPNVLPIGGVTQLTISGTGFETGSSVRVCSNGLTLSSVAILDANTILVEVDVPAGQAEGTCGVRIDNPDGERVIARDVVTITAS